jgi:hypothetical protein
MIKRRAQSRDGADKEAWLREVLLASVLYRLLNKVETFQTFGGIPDTPQEIKKFLKFIKAKMSSGGPAVFTSAHINMGFVNYRRVANNIVQPQTLDTIAEQVLAAKELHQVPDVLETLKNLGAFYAWQVTCDLMECGCLPNFGENDYARLGKGAVKGIRIIFGVDAYDHVNLAKLLESLQVLVFATLNVSFPYFADRKLTVKNIEHALCEFSKYIAIQKSLSAG